MGPARSGKTTLLLSLLHDYASQAAGREDGEASHSSYCEEMRVPLYLDLGQLASSHSLEGLASQWCSVTLGQDISTDQVSELLMQGECLVLLDHMDRLVGRQHLEGLNALREFMVERYPQHRYVLALPEYEYTLLEDWLPAVHALHLGPLVEEEVLAFLHAQGGESQARRMARLLRTRGLWSLTEDPLFLPMLTELVKEYDDREPSRAQALDRIWGTLLSGLEGYSVPLAEMALALHREGKDEFEWSRCQGVFSNNAKDSDGAEACRTLLAAGVLRSDPKCQRLRFRHSYLQLFQAGQAVGRAIEAGRSLPDILGNLSQTWEEPLSLLYGSVAGSARLLQALLTPEATFEAIFLAAYCVVQNEPREKVRTTLHPQFFDPQTNFLLGRALFRLGYYEEARLELEEALRFRPDRADINYELALVLKALGKSEGALASYERASSLGPPSSEVALEASMERAKTQDPSSAAATMEAALQMLNQRKAEAHCQLSEIYLETGQLNDALAQAEESLRLASSARFQCQIGRVLAFMGNRDEAKKRLQQAISDDPGLVLALLALGRVHEEEGRLDAALVQYKSALEREPDHPDSYLNLGRIYRLKGQFLLAKVYIGTALDLDPSHAAALAEMGALLEAQERYNEAAEQLRRAIDLNPRESGYHYRLGWLLKLASRPAQAETELRASIDLSPDRPEYYNQLGVVLADLERHREALGAYQRASQLDSQNPLYFRNVGVALAQLGHNQEALRAFERTLELCEVPGGRDDALLTNLIAADAHSERGQILEKLGDATSALGEYQRAVELMPTESAYRLRQALAYGHFSEPNRMLHILRRTVQMRPDDGQSHHHLGEALETVGEIEEALEAFQAAVKLAPEEAQFWKSLGRVQRTLGQTAASVESLIRARDLLPAEADMHYQLGLSLEGAGRVQEAEECYRGAARRDVNREEYWMALGRCCRILGRLADSQAALRRVLFLNPAHTMAHSELAETQLRQGRREEALAEALSAIKGDPEVGHYHHQAAVICREMGLRQDALLYLSRAVDLQPHRADWRRELGEVYEDMGELENSLAEYEKACQWDPDSPRGFFLLGRLHHRLGRVDDALNELERAVRLDPSAVEARTFLARLHLEKGDAEEALEHCRVLMPVASQDPQPFYLAFQSLLKLGREAEAIQVLEKATALSPDDPAWQRELGQAYAGVGRLLEAQQSYQRAVSIGDTPELRRELAHVYRRMGWKQEAVKELQLALDGVSKQSVETRGLWLLDMGDFLQDSRDWDGAAQAYEEAEKLLGGRGDVCERKGSLLVRMGNFQEARALLERAAAGGYVEPKVSHTLSLALIGMGDLEGAARAAIKAAFAEPANAEFQRHLGSVLRLKGDLSSAINYLQRALDLSPSDPHNLHQMALALEDKGDVQEALRLCREAMEAAPEEPAFHLDLGRLLLGLDRAEEARLQLESAVEGDPDNPQAHFLLGQALEARGSLERSKEQYSVSARLEPQVALYHYHLGKSLEALGDFTGSAAALSRALEMNEGQASWHSDLASLYSLMGEYDLASKEYRRALDLAPKGYGNYLRAGAFYRERGMLADAASLLEKAVAEAPGRPEAHHQLGLTRLSLGQATEALRSLERAVELAPKEVRYQIDVANALRQNGDCTEAAKRLLSITKALPESAEAHYALGQALADQRWHGEAVAPLSRAVELNPGEARYRCVLARTFMALGQFDEALEQLKLAEVSPSARSGEFVMIGTVYEEMGRLEEALAVYRQGLEGEQRADLYYRASLVLRLLRREEDALASLRAALALEERASWHNELGEQLEQQGLASEALPCFQRAVRMEPKEPLFHRNLGVTLEKLHRYDTARESLEEAIRLRHDYRDALGHLASVTAKLTLEREVKKRSSQY
ncbi:MAG: tetratricopeptide repeat protein [Dehalococcoidia bacterium]|nr:tetratricopeptide repeat protein [Dehalococcoidia bacterium]